MSADIQQLIARKESIERTIAAKGEILRDNNSTMQSPLVDAEGFPRADIDIYAVRGARVRIIELRNDLKQVTDDISVALQVIYDPAKNAEPAVNGASTPDDLKPFARVDGVAPGSPATEAGLLREDLILRFGPLTHTDAGSTLQPLAKVVGENENRPLRVSLLREGSPKTIIFTPRKWDGRGLLGCHIVPYSAP